MQNYLFQVLVRALVVLTLLPVHEFAHAWVADRLGDRTARYQGRLTLNPIKHIDPIGSILILLTGFGWAKPVPVNPYNFRKPKRDMAITAAAGPLSNILVAFVLYFIARVVIAFFPSLLLNSIASFLVNVLIMMAQINVGLAVFNLIPVPPLDGSKILGMFLPDHIYNMMYQYQMVIYVGLMLLLFTGVLDRPMAFVSGVIWDLFNLLTAFLR